MNIILANPRGFCAGVDRAVQIVKKALDYFNSVYVRHEIVHNRFIVDQLKKQGVIFVEDLNEVPEGELVIFSAHGVSKSVEKLAKYRRLKVLDATCPLVTKVHLEVIRYQKQRRSVIMIGHRGHPEVEGTLGRYDASENSQIYLVETTDDVAKLNLDRHQPLAYITQTTLSVDDTKTIVDAIKNRFSNLKEPKGQDICYATQNRQEAVKALLPMVDLLLIIGSNSSSNSNRLKEIGQINQMPSYLIDDTNQIQKHWFEGVKTIGISSGASAPEILVENVISFLKENYPIQSVLKNGIIQENVRFSLPNIRHL